MPVSVARLLMSSVNASMPPAEAPTAAIKKSFLRSEAAGVSSLEELRGWLAPDNFDFIFSPSRLSGWPFTWQGGERVVDCRYGGNNGIATTCVLASAARVTTQGILVLPLARNNLILWRRENPRRGVRGIAVRDSRPGLGVSSAMLGLKDFRGPASEIVDEMQILLAGLRYGPVMCRERTPNAGGFSNERRGLDGADACIQHSFQEVGPGKDGAVSYVGNDNARSGFQSGTARRVARIDGIKKLEERFLKATMHQDTQTLRFAIVGLDVAHVGAGAFDDGA